MVLTDEIKAYLAGIIDGEGCISAYKHNATRTIHPHFSIDMTQKAPIDLFSEYFGGTVYIYLPKNDNRKLIYTYRATGKRAYEILRTLSPYLRVKKHQAIFAMEMFHLKQVPKKLIDYSKVEHIYHMLRSLNA